MADIFYRQRIAEEKEEARYWMAVAFWMEQGYDEEEAIKIVEGEDED